MVWTCQHLVQAPLEPHPYRFYARCRLGSETQRLEWLGQVRRARLERLRQLQSTMAPINARFVEQLWLLEGRQVAAQRANAPTTEVSGKLRTTAGRYLAEVEAHLRRRSGELDAVGAPLRASMKLLRTLTERWIEQPTITPPEITEDLVAEFPEPVRLLFRPEPPEAAGLAERRSGPRAASRPPAQGPRVVRRAIAGAAAGRAAAGQDETLHIRSNMSPRER